MRTRTVSGNNIASKHALKQVELFCAGVNISSRYKRNARDIILVVCMVIYLLPFERQRKTVNYLTVFGDIWRNQLWPSGWKKDDVNRCLEFFFADHGENCLVCPTSLSRS